MPTCWRPLLHCVNPSAGAGIIGPGLTSVMQMNVGHNVLSNLGPHALDNAFHQLRSLSEDRGLNSIAVSRGLDSVMELNNSQYNSNDQSGA